MTEEVSSEPATAQAFDEGAVKAENQLAPYVAPLPKRPHGSGLRLTGVLMMIAGAIAALIGAFAPEIASPGSPGIGDIVPPTPATYNTWKWPALWLGAAGLNLGLLLWALGTIVRALFFLPGREVSAEEVW